MKKLNLAISQYFVMTLLTAGLLSFPATSYAKEKEVAGKHANKNPVVRLQTTAGDIDIELLPNKSPVSVKNFIGYVESGFYNGTIFHRVIKGFMIQGGGFTSGIKKDSKKPRENIKNEADNGLKNKTGTISMARLPHPHSASSQFFINTKDNVSLDHKGKTPTGWGYAVFGKVVKGMKVVRKIEDSATHTVGYYQNVPKTEVIITKAWILGAKSEKSADKEKIKKK